MSSPIYLVFLFLFSFYMLELGFGLYSIILRFC